MENMRKRLEGNVGAAGRCGECGEGGEDVGEKIKKNMGLQVEEKVNYLMFKYIVCDFLPHANVAKWCRLWSWGMGSLV